MTCPKCVLAETCKNKPEKCPLYHSTDVECEDTTQYERDYKRYPEDYKEEK